MSDIALNAGIRSNLLQLQNSAGLFDRTTQRLASGKEVNSAIDNPTNFFASVNLTDRADALDSRLDGMGQAIQRIQAADNGITTIRSFISALSGVVNNALGNTDSDARNALGRQFNELIVQISETAKDSGYAGINLLERNQTETVQFSETFDDSVLDVRGFDLRGPGTDGRGRVDTNGDVASAAITAVINQASQAAVASASEISATQSAVASATLSFTVDSTASVGSTAAVGSTASVSQSGYSNAAATAGGGTTSALVGVTGFTNIAGTSNAAVTVGTASNSNFTAANSNSTASNSNTTASAATASQAAITATRAAVASAASVAAGTVTSAVALALDTQDDTAVGIQGAGTGAGMVNWGGTDYQNTLASVVQQLEEFDSAINQQASNLAQNLSTITIREDFTNELINTLTEGSDKLTLADLNEEGANLLALQTSQALATQSLSLAAQQSQQVLQLLG